MHIIHTVPSGSGYRWKCSCGANGNMYNTESQALSVGLSHKQAAEEEKPDGYRDDPRVGY